MATLHESVNKALGEKLEQLQIKVIEVMLTQLAAGKCDAKLLEVIEKTCARHGIQYNPDDLAKGLKASAELLENLPFKVETNADIRA